MSRWRLELTDEFEKALKKLNKPVRQRVAAALDQIVELDDPRSRGKGLSGNLNPAHNLGKQVDAGSHVRTAGELALVVRDPR